jgi:hypothetical protein
MATLDRSTTIGLLDRLGAADDAAVLEAARTLHRSLNEAGTSWDELLRPASQWPGAEPGDDAAPVSEQQPVPEGDLSEEDKAEAGRLIGRLLARKGISDTLREDLGDLKQLLEDGSFEAMDLRYIRALARRLGV